MRSHLRALQEIGVIVKRRRNAFPGANTYELEKPGEELLFVARRLEQWLATAPEEPLELGSDMAKAAIRALVEGWSSTLLRAIAARPLSLTELDRIIGDLSYPSLERRLGAMRLTGQIKVAPAGNGKGTPYEVTEWLRRGIAPIIAATRWERRNAPNTTAAIGRIDVETAFLLSVPLLELSEILSGTCQLAVELSNGTDRRLAGVMVGVEKGRIVSCTTRLAHGGNGWAIGSASAWFRSVIEADPAQLETGGDGRLARGLLEGLFQALFGAGARRSSQAV
jgi:DNA-binding HxlR family transcriptional regulator